MFAESSLTPFPGGANMHPCFRASVRLRTSLGLATLWAEKRLLAQQASLSLQPPEDP